MAITIESLTFSTGDEYAHRLPSETSCWFWLQLHLCPLGSWTMSLGSFHLSMFCHTDGWSVKCLDCPFGSPVTFPTQMPHQISSYLFHVLLHLLENISNWMVRLWLVVSTLTIFCILLANNGLADTLWNDVAAFGPWNAWNAGGWCVG